MVIRVLRRTFYRSIALAIFIIIMALPFVMTQVFGSGGTCNGDAQCNNDNVCVRGNCQNPTPTPTVIPTYPPAGGGTSGGGCIPVTSCGSNCGSVYDGCGGYLNCGSCTNGSGNNYGGTGGGSCTTNSDCNNGKVCNNGTCVQCNNSSQCPQGYQCSNNNCVVVQTGTCVPATCGTACGTSVADGCGGFLNCGSCCTPQTTCNGQCGTISDGCGGSLNCGTCGTGGIGGTTCVRQTTCNGACGIISDGCGGTLNCGSCTSGSGGSTGCTSDSQCINGYVCSNGACVPGGSGGSGSCSTNAQCTNGYVCVNGACTNPNPGAFCLANSNCPTGYVCVNNACTLQGGPGFKCLSNTDCINGYACVNGTCTASPYIQGCVFNDTNGDGFQESGETNYTAGAINVSITSGTGSITPTYSNGCFTAYVPSGSYTVTYSSPPPGYSITQPKPPQYNVSVGSICSVLPDNLDGRCDTASNAVDLNFGLSNSGTAWVQGVGAMHVRDDGGELPMTIPTTASASCGSGYALVKGSESLPGIFFSGNKDVNFLPGSVSEKSWLVGGTTYPEAYGKQATGQLATSYALTVGKLKRSGAQITDLTTVAGCNNLGACQLPSTLPSGTYQATDSVTLQNFSVFQAGGNKHVILLIDGSLTINAQMHVPTGSTLVVITSGDIVVSSSLGDVTPTCTGTSAIDGMFSTDQNFIVQGINDCTIKADPMLTISGSIVVNAARKGGTFQNERSLCSNNSLYPAIRIKDRLDMLLNYPFSLLEDSSSWQEQAP